MTTKLQKMNALLKRGWINLSIVKHGKRYVGKTDRGETLDPFGFGSRTKREFKEWIASRYMAEVYTDSAYINPRWALKNPRFCGRYGGLHELSCLLKTP